MLACFGSYPDLVSVPVAVCDALGRGDPIYSDLTVQVLLARVLPSVVELGHVIALVSVLVMCEC